MNTYYSKRLSVCIWLHLLWLKAPHWLSKTAMLSYPETYLRDIWNNVFRHRSPFYLLAPSSRTFDCDIIPNQENPWSLIFKNFEWLTEAEKTFSMDPILIGRSLGRDPRGQRGQRYMVLAIRNKSGGLSIEFKKNYSDLEDFLKTLQDHDEPDYERQEITFKSGIVLNVYDIFISKRIIQVDPGRLFRGRRPKSTQYMFWNDPEKKLRRANKRDFVGVYNGINIL